MKSPVQKIITAGLGVAVVATGAFFVDHSISNTAVSLPSAQVVGTSTPVGSTPTQGTPSARAGKGKGGLLQHAEHATVDIYSKKNGMVTVTVDRGTVQAISSSSVTIVHPDGTTVSVPVSSATLFPRLSESTIASDISSNTPVKALVVQKGGTASRIIATTPPSTPKTTA
ncbi:MAG: hypothetical protein M0T78_09225 [Actinomycetota bacterium]|jgi:hypothetical protein|nr:hypothetical protein [Actinomycetota bacterium]